MKFFLCWLIRIVLRVIAKIQITGIENLPKKGGFVIAVNHLGILDAPLAYYGLDNWNIFIPVAEKWEENPFLKWLGKHLSFIFINRFEPDLKSMREMIKRMESGQTLVIAPEGTRHYVTEWKMGFYHIAKKAGIPLVVGIVDGKNKTVHIGQVFHPTDNMDADIKTIKGYFEGTVGINPKKKYITLKD